MAAKRSVAREHVLNHQDGTIWAKGQTVDGVPTGYWEWYRKDGTRMRSGSFEAGQQVGQWTTYDQQGRIYKVTTMKPKPEAGSKVAKRVKHIPPRSSTGRQAKRSRSRARPT